MKTTTKWTSKDFPILYDQAKEGTCDKDCNNCLLFLENRKECYLKYEKKFEEWNRKRSNEFQERMKNYKV